MLGTLAIIWALLGVFALLGNAIYRLALISIAAFDHPMSWLHWLVLIVWVLFMAHREGYAGFQKGFSPRVAARVAYLRDHPTALRALLAPLFCMGFFHIVRRRQIVVIALTAMIVLFVVIARQLPQPWRGIVDLGVVVGLLWGVISLGIFTISALRGTLDASPEMPESEPASTS